MNIKNSLLVCIAMILHSSLSFGSTPSYTTDNPYLRMNNLAAKHGIKITEDSFINIFDHGTRIACVYIEGTRVGTVISILGKYNIGTPLGTIYSDLFAKLVTR